MMVEILGAKVLSPYFGVSLYVWSALITVTLLSLALGYFLGGKWADRKPGLRTLYGIVACSGLAVAVIPRLTSIVIEATGEWELRLGTLASALALFGFPLIALGMVSPFGVRIAANRLEDVGSRAGTLYAISTLGSLLGTLLTGFVLIPVFPLDKIFYLVAALLVAVSVAGFLTTGPARIDIARLLLVILALGSLTALPRESRGDIRGTSKILYKSSGFYGEIKVVDGLTTRSLLVDGSPQNFVGKGAEPGSLMKQTAYVMYLSALLVYRPGLDRVLMIGLGGGTLATVLARYGVAVDVIEIDPRMEATAERFFGYKRGRGNFYAGDGRYVLRRLQGPYDAVVLDAFASYDQPAHLFSREMFAEVRRVLGEDGVFAINSAGFVEGPQARIQRAIAKTLEEAFPHMEAFAIEGEKRVGNVVFFASGAPLELRSGRSRLPLGDEVGVIAVLRDTAVKEKLKGGIIITDNYNPLALWGGPISRAWREEVVHFFGRDVLKD
jgi:spermidine synthase